MNTFVGFSPWVIMGMLGFANKQTMRDTYSIWKVPAWQRNKETTWLVEHYFNHESMGNAYLLQQQNMHQVFAGNNLNFLNRQFAIHQMKGSFTFTHLPCPEWLYVAGYPSMTLTWPHDSYTFEHKGTTMIFIPENRVKVHTWQSHPVYSVDLGRHVIRLMPFKQELPLSITDLWELCCNIELLWPTQQEEMPVNLMIPTFSGSHLMDLFPWINELYFLPFKNGQISSSAVRLIRGFLETSLRIDPLGIILGNQTLYNTTQMHKDNRSRTAVRLTKGTVMWIYDRQLAMPIVSMYIPGTEER